MTRNKYVPGTMTLNPVLSHDGQVEIAKKFAHLTRAAFIPFFEAELVSRGTRANDDTMFEKHTLAREIHLANTSAEAQKPVASVAEVAKVVRTGR